ncbi:MAG TPA: endonuclease/exonuclease/phosphatase family protein [Polyangia bacterium]|nr:endonuclease/exonuclease/phosphatase family protein [Polyangia bacterium]
MAGRLRRLAAHGLRVCALAYPLALLAVAGAFRFVGERWWPTTVGLYLPRVGFALPLPLLSLLLLLGRAYWWLLTQLLAVVLLLFPVMGLHLSGARVAAAGGAPPLRVLTFNVNDGRMGIDQVTAQARAAGADLILFQEAAHTSEDRLRAGLPGYRFVARDQFVLFSRFPVEEVFIPPPSIEGDVAYPWRFVRYRIGAPGGPVHVYNVHPISPREALEELHGRGLREEVASGRILTPRVRPLVANARRRVAQVQAFVADARRSPYPVIIAGDTNLPQGSWAAARWLGDFQDAFAERGAGFGYTFPAPRHPWMRIDRILTDGHFRVLDCRVLPAGASDHLALVAELQRAADPR